MYRCDEIEIPRLYVMRIGDLEKGNMDKGVREGFECFLSPYLDLKKCNIKKAVYALEQRGCTHIIEPARLVRDIKIARAIERAPFTREYADQYPFKYAAEKTMTEMEADLVFVCEDEPSEYKNSEADLFEWIHDIYHPIGWEVILPSTTSFETPLGAVSVIGPNGPIPFQVTQLLNRYSVDGRTKSIIKCENLYTITIMLDELENYEKYYAGCEGRSLVRSGSDEYTVCYSCVAEGFAFGIGTYNPSEDWDIPTPDESRLNGYYVSRDFKSDIYHDICITPVPQGRDWVKKVHFDVGWLEYWSDRRGDWYNAEELLAHFLT